MDKITWENIGDTALKTVRQLCLLPYLLLIAAGCAAASAGLCFWDEFTDYWRRNL